ncbi:MAG: glycosyltransferase [Desulfurococcales archaeon]|nr:glycosyltransferase [Desulfurococcales archaeon]
MFKLISIIMPVYNGESYIAYSIHTVSEFLKHYNLPHEIIIVDDGSRDNTRNKALKTSKDHQNIKVVGYKQNHGKGVAFLYGYKHSKGNILVLFDSDLDIPPEQIPILLAVMRKTKADIVITNKWHPLSRTKASNLRYFLSKSYNSIVKLLTGLKLNDTQTGAKAIKRQVLDNIAPKMYVKRYAFDVELLLLATKLGYRITEAPSLKPINLSSTFRPREILLMLLELISITYRQGRL